MDKLEIVICPCFRFAHVDDLFGFKRERNFNFQQLYGYTEK